MNKENGILNNVTEEDIQLLKTNPNEFWAGVNEIGMLAFKGLQNLEEIVIPKSVTKLGYYCFQSCRNLKSVSILGNVQSIPNYAFQDCFLLTEVNLPNSVRAIYNNAFEKCIELKNINMPKSLETIGYRAFSCCGFKNLEIPEFVNDIDDYAFSYCPNLESVKIQGKIESIKEGAFMQCANLNSITGINNALSIAGNAFTRCVSLEQVDISSAEEIQDSAFSECVCLKDIKLSENLKYIGRKAFESTAIKNVSLPATLEEIKSSAFRFCSSLETVNLSLNLTKIPSDCFKDCSALKQVNNMENITEIGHSAFAYCVSLEEIKIPAILEKLQESAFMQCSSLKEISLPEQITQIKPSTFQNCSNLKKISFSSSMQKIGSYAFYDSGLETITIPSTVNTIEARAFCHSENLKEVVFEKNNNIRVLESSMFRDCKNLERVVNFPSTIIEIKNGAFFNCTALKDIQFSTNLMYVNNNVFTYCDNIPDMNATNLERVGSEGFYKYLYEDSCQFFCTNTKPEKFEYVNISHCGDVAPYLMDNWDNKVLRNIINTSGAGVSKLVSELMLKYRQEESDILERLDFTWFNKFVKNLERNKISYNALSNPEKSSLFIAFYNLGAMQFFIKEKKDRKNGEIVIKQIPYGQIVSEFFVQQIVTGKTSLKELSNMFMLMNLSGFKKDFSDFLFGNGGKNFEDMLKTYKEFPKFVSTCYNEFEEMQASNTKNKGEQKELKPTHKHFYDAYIGVEGVTENNQNIAKVIRRYHAGKLAQKTFNRARIINAERLGFKFEKEIEENNSKLFDALNLIEQGQYDVALEKYNGLISKPNNAVKDNIVGVDLIEQDNLVTERFSNLNRLLDESESLSAKTLKMAADIASKQFKYEWLKKSDPMNFVLGKLCKCCSHLEGMGYGITRASIIHPSIQTMVIRDAKNQIVAKSTLFVNEKEQYAVFNNVEVNTDLNSTDFKFIYDKYMKGVEKFAETYNKNNPNNQLKIITVGLSNNDLISYLRKNNKPSNVLFKSVNYGEYGIEAEHMDHEGDSDKEQYVVYENEKE